jgi:indolepyruvate ferredoxin oxidoreductase
MIVVNTAEVMPGDFVRNPDFSLPSERIKRAVLSTVGRENAAFVNATGLATALLGNAIAANMFVLGYAFQKGRVPLSSDAIKRAIELNGEAVQMNLHAFEWGRRAAIDLPRVEAIAAPALKGTKARQLAETLEEKIARRADFLTAYQNRAYAERYLKQVEAVRAAEQRTTPGETNLTEAVVKYLFKLMAIKDEYEVGRLYTDGAFRKQLETAFEGDLKLEFHLAPPLLGKRDPQTGLPLKTSFGPWAIHMFRMLAALRGLRGTALDIFGRTAERKMERQLLADYEKLIIELCSALTPLNKALAIGLASLPDRIRGFGHVKERHVEAAQAEETALLAQFRAGGAVQPLAAE